MEFNLGTLVTTAIAAFISGSGLTAIAMLFNFSNKLGKFETTLDIINRQLGEHMKSPPVVCLLHQEAEKDVNSLKTRVAVLEEKTERG